jgi:hypothetical protein
MRCGGDVWWIADMVTCTFRRLECTDEFPVSFPIFPCGTVSLNILVVHVQHQNLNTSDNVLCVSIGEPETDTERRARDNRTTGRQLTRELWQTRAGCGVTGTPRPRPRPRPRPVSAEPHRQAGPADRVPQPCPTRQRTKRPPRVRPPLHGLAAASSPSTAVRPTSLPLVSLPPPHLRPPAPVEAPPPLRRADLTDPSRVRPIPTAKTLQISRIPNKAAARRRARQLAS